VKNYSYFGIEFLCYFQKKVSFEVNRRIGKFWDLLGHFDKKDFDNNHFLLNNSRACLMLRCRSEGGERNKVGRICER